MPTYLANMPHVIEDTSFACADVSFFDTFHSSSSSSQHASTSNHQSTMTIPLRTQMTFAMTTPSISSPTLMTCCSPIEIVRLVAMLSRNRHYSLGFHTPRVIQTVVQASYLSQMTRPMLVMSMISFNLLSVPKLGIYLSEWTPIASVPSRLPPSGLLELVVRPSPHPSPRIKTLL
jgi:hypothetical protein